MKLGADKMNIALIAHDKKKPAMIRFCKKYENILSHHTLIATGTTGAKIVESTDLKVRQFRSGPLGGDQEIGARIAQGKVDMVLFFRDPLTPQPHEPDVNAFFRLVDVYEIPLASNFVSAELIFKGLTYEEKKPLNKKKS
jgi:methylglyoxal synthase